jgi:hypothetical protein
VGFKILFWDFWEIGIFFVNFKNVFEKKVVILIITPM